MISFESDQRCRSCGIWVSLPLGHRLRHPRHDIGGRHRAAWHRWFGHPYAMILDLGPIKDRLTYSYDLPPGSVWVERDVRRRCSCGAERTAGERYMERESSPEVRALRERMIAALDAQLRKDIAQ